MNDVQPIYAWGQVGPGCDYWSDGTWKACCDLHDVAFTNGGTLFQWAQANWDLGSCVWVHDPINSVIMFVGVMVGSIGMWKFRKGVKK